MSKTGPLDRLDRQHFTPVAPQAVIWAMAPGQDTARGGSMQCLLQRGEQPAQPHSTGAGGGKQWSSMKLQGTWHGTDQGVEGKAPGGACSPER